MTAEEYAIIETLQKNFVELVKQVQYQITALEGKINAHIVGEDVTSIISGLDEMSKQVEFVYSLQKGEFDYKRQFVHDQEARQKKK